MNDDTLTLVAIVFGAICYILGIIVGKNFKHFTEE